MKLTERKGKIVEQMRISPINKGNFAALCEDATA